MIASAAAEVLDSGVAETETTDLYANGLQLGESSGEAGHDTTVPACSTRVA